MPSSLDIALSAKNRENPEALEEAKRLLEEAKNLLDDKK